MFKKNLVQILSLLCAVCFAAGGFTLFSSSVSGVAEQQTAVVVTSAPTSSLGAYSSKTSSVSSTAASGKVLISSLRAKKATSGPKSSSGSKPNDYIGQLNNKSQNIPDGMKQSPDKSNSSKTASKNSSGKTSGKSTSSKKTSSGKTNSKKPVSSKPVSSSSGIKDDGETIFLSVDGKVKEYSALDAVALNVGAEMDDYFEDEAIKAQAVAAHTYMVYTNANGKAPVLPLRTPSAHLKGLVKSVLDKLIYYNNKPINAVYFATAGGYTANAEDIWGSNIPYLKSVESKYDYLVKGYKTTKTYSASDFKRVIKANAGIALTGSASGWLKVLNLADGGYVGNMTIGGKKKATINGSSRTINGNLFRETILDFGIRSPKFEFKANDDSITFTSYGWGHGVGLSQDGADMYASKEGRGYQWILKHYYTGVTIK